MCLYGNSYKHSLWTENLYFFPFLFLSFFFSLEEWREITLFSLIQRNALFKYQVPLPFQAGVHQHYSSVIILSDKPLGKLQHAEVFLKQQQLQQKPFTFFFLKNLQTFLIPQLWILTLLLPLRICTSSTVPGPLIMYSSEECQQHSAFYVYYFKRESLILSRSFHYILSAVPSSCSR